MLIRLKRRPHTFGNAGFETDFGKSKVKECLLDMCLFCEKLVKTVHFQLRLETEVLNLAKPPPGLELENGRLYPIRRTNLETKLLEVRHKVKGRNSSTLAY